MGQNESLPELPEGQTELRLARKKLEEIPYYLPPDSPVTNIDLTKDKIRRFPLELKNVKCINLTDNELYDILRRMPEIEINYPNLTTLILSDNSLVSVPHSLYTLKKLKQLSLDRNNLNEISLNFPELETLNLLINCFTEVPKLPDSLLSLNLSFNSIRLLSFSLPNLRELNLSGNEISEISPSISFPSLTTLDLSYNNISSVPPVTTFAPNLEVMIFSFNFLVSFPTYLPISLKKVDVSHNAIEKWEDPIVHLIYLTSLDISYNRITEVPELPPNIESFIPHHNQIKKVFPISSTKLKRIIFTKNNLPFIPNTKQSTIECLHCDANMIDNIDTENIPETIKKLDLSCSFIGDVPVSLCDFSTLQLLDLSANHIVKLPDEMHKMSGLQNLLINENPISSLPQLPPSLQTLACCRCQFTELPSSVFSIQHLVRIDFSCNRIKKVGSFPDVPYINLNCNVIKKVPTLPQCIISLQVAHNKLKKFNLEKEYELLQELDVSHNEISQLTLKPLPSLRSLKLSFNPLKYDVDFTNFPAIDSIDLCDVECNFGTAQIPTQIREIICSDADWFSKTTNAQHKLFHSAKAGYSEQCGTRPTMEDSLIIRDYPLPELYGVIDGHGGYRTSSLAAYLIPLYFQKSENKSMSGVSEIIKKLNDQLRKFQVRDGATLVLATVTKSEIGCAHVGDARALIVKSDGSINQLTSDHKATDRTEIGIIKENRAFLSSGRLMGTLAVSRAIGDFSIEGVMRIPSMTVYSIKKETDIRLVLACDGVFDVMSNEEVGRIAAEYRDVSTAAAVIRNLAFARGSQDNLSVVVVDIEDHDQ